MRHQELWILAAVFFVAPVQIASADITYPRGTTLEEAWTSPARISVSEAVEILADRLLSRPRSGEEIELGPEDFEAFKFLVGNDEQVSEEPSAPSSMRRFGGELGADQMTDEQRDFFRDLSIAVSTKLGLAALSLPGACVRQVRLFEHTKYKYDVGWNEVDVWGITAFGHNLQYAANHSDLVYGVFPWGVQMSWIGALGCVLGSTPDDEDGLRACGRTKEWKLHGASHVKLLSSYEHVVPGIAQSSLPYAGALVSGEAGQFQTNSQTRNTLDPTWLLGPSNVPLPSYVTPADGCVGQCPMGVAVQYVYDFSQVIAWWPNIILNASYNNPNPVRFEKFDFFGKDDGNPHSLGNFGVKRDFSRHHPPIPACS